MKKYSWIAILLVAVMVSGLALATKPVLTVGTDATYAPFESIDKNGNFVGFDMDLMRLVADQTGMELKLVNINWDGIIPGLMNGNYDCLISAMTITPERKKQINFSDPYFSIRQAIVVKKDNNTIKGPKDLEGKTVTVQNGTTGDLYASKIKSIKMKRFDTNPQAIQELLNNNADAAVMDDLVAISAIKTASGLKMVTIEDIEPENYGIGIRKDNTALLAKINQAIDALKKNGKLAALEKQYLGK
ncbi:MAG TPA: basic amino acid ABC transporter substrate-binding protein [Bacillota bacterium]